MIKNLDFEKRVSSFSMVLLAVWKSVSPHFIHTKDYLFKILLGLREEERLWKSGQRFTL